MFRILYATDGSGHAAAAGKVLDAWSLAGRAHVTVLTVVPPIPLFSSSLIGPSSAGWAEVPSIVERETEAAMRIAEAAAAPLRERGAAVECAVRHGAPAEEILKLLEELKPDLVLLGSHGQSRLGRLLIGGVSQNVARHAPCSALVVRDREPWRGRFLIAVDGSLQSENAMRLVASLPVPQGQACTVLHVLQPMLEPGDPRIPQREAAAEHLVEKTAVALTGAGYRSVPEVREGHPAQEILRAAREIQTDLIVVGERGLSGIQEFLLGSVSARVLRYAPCSVLIAR
jgi:nucleotide-binding universal stress UspA family protein